MFAEKIEHFGSSMWPDTVLHEPRAVPTVIQSILNGHKLMENVQIFCCCNRMDSEKRVQLDKKSAAPSVDELCNFVRINSLVS
ncbi:hypothetical protein AVEN_270530-1 [Araneus ventricosus]|uniref:Uncharacterized protein n=1 Tax=Araneus ventricosus TaxID=182803 RepID=A0A4Y2B4K5_ARAVE|nr:hypothetical protein AVEN_270530-1 [Araneus ventricosus]